MITSTYKPSKTSAPAKSFVHFCQALANTPPRTLELIVALEKATTSLPATSQVTNMKSQLDQLFQPLTLLKLVSLRNFRAGQWDELQLILFPAAKQLLYFPKIENAGDAEAIALLTEMGKKFKAAVWRSASTNVVDMHAKLISYAQSFERNEEYRKDMAAVQIHVSAYLLLAFWISCHFLRHEDPAAPNLSSLFPNLAQLNLRLGPLARTRPYQLL